MITINKDWIVEDFKQKYFLYCRNCTFSIKKFGELELKPYICKQIIKIEEL